MNFNAPMISPLPIALRAVRRFIAMLPVLLSCAAFAAEVDTSKLPPPASTPVDFDHDVRPIFESVCYKCHGAEKPRSKFSLISKETALKGGSQGIDILPGQSEKSPLIHFVARLVEDMEMPPAGKGEPLTKDQIAVLRKWIDQGANWSATATPAVKGPQFSVSPTVQFISVSGNVAKFREHYWMKEGWSGGLENFELKEKLDGERTVTAEGRVIPNQGDYKIALTLEKTDFGFARFGFEQYRKYFSDVGGSFAFPNSSLSSFSLDRDLHLNIGRAWTEFGLTLPDWPRIVFGYEYQFKDGAKSLLQWGDVYYGQVGDTRKIYPAYQDTDEKVHIIKLDVTHDIHGVQLEDNFRAEFYDLATSRFNVDTFRPGKPEPDKLVLTQDGYTHFQAANTFRAEKQFTDWLFASAGYLYSRLDGDAQVNVNTVLTPFAALPPTSDYFEGDHRWLSRRIVLDQETHIFSANTMLGPWQGLTLSGGLQTEWMSQHGIGDVNVDDYQLQEAPDSGELAIKLIEYPATLRADIDRFTVDENFGLRFTKIPFTVLYAESRFQQERLGQFEDENQATRGRHDFLRNTDATSDLKEYRAGFNVSPWQRVSLNARFRHRDKDSDYIHTLDKVRLYNQEGSAGTFLGLDDGNGYSAFIRSRQIQTDEAQFKLVLKPTAWLKTTLGYQIVATDFHTSTDASPDANSPGGRIFAGNYDAHVYSLNTTLTPWRRLYLSTTFSYQNTRTWTPADDTTKVVSEFRGGVYSVLASGTYVVNAATDLTASYSFSHADYGQHNDGLPLGVIYDLHGVQVGLTRQLNKNLKLRLQYGFYKYDEPTSGTVNNYTAHAVFATMNYKWP
ncbi:MAG: hypothetical protein HY043_08045 [Verrucomicrobia bacterium]|nr:hypothetical protein [Verrucomicrobiota bacterium]